jgi:hypothetical protein
MIILFFVALFSRGGAFAATSKQKTFESPEAAVAALVEAAKEGNIKELKVLLGPGSEQIISSGDQVQDQKDREKFVKGYSEKNRLEKNSDGKVILLIGHDDWPLPFPIVKTEKRWRFDTQAGKDEILNRRLGKNELNAIQVILAIVDAQREYADTMSDKYGHPEYAQKFESGKGKKDGLHWETSQNEKPSPLGPLVARARAEGYKSSVGKSESYHGYFYKILKAQGKSVNGGAYSYIINGKMIAGFAVAAYPAVYGSSGVHSFIVNHEGIVYRKDLKKSSVKIAAAMKEFNPDETWKKIE